MGQPVGPLFRGHQPNQERAPEVLRELLGWAVSADPAMGGYALVDRVRVRVPVGGGLGRVHGTWDTGSRSTCAGRIWRPTLTAPSNLGGARVAPADGTARRLWHDCDHATRRKPCRSSGPDDPWRRTAGWRDRDEATDEALRALASRRRRGHPGGSWRTMSLAAGEIARLRRHGRPSATTLTVLRHAGLRPSAGTARRRLYRARPEGLAACRGSWTICGAIPRPGPGACVEAEAWISDDNGAAEAG